MNGIVVESDLSVRRARGWKFQAAADLRNDEISPRTRPANEEHEVILGSY